MTAIGFSLICFGLIIGTIFDEGSIFSLNRSFLVAYACFMVGVGLMVAGITIWLWRWMP